MTNAPATRPLMRWALTLAAALAGSIGLASQAEAATALEARPVVAFDRIVFDAPGELRITQAPTEALTVEAESRLLPQLRTRIDGGTLTISVAGSLRTREPIRWNVSLRSLVELRAGGSGEVSIGALRTPTLALHLSGSGTTRLADLQAEALSIRVDDAHQATIRSGRLLRQRVDIADAASYDAGALASVEADATLADSAQARLRVERRLDARVGDSGQLHYFGSPRLTQQLSDAGAIERAGP